MPPTWPDHVVDDGPAATVRVPDVVVAQPTSPTTHHGSMGGTRWSTARPSGAPSTPGPPTWPSA